MGALRMARGQQQPKEGLLHHWDRGCQYASEAYREHLAAWNVTPSMSRRGHCYDNAAMESFWSTLKAALIHLTSSQAPWCLQNRGNLKAPPSCADASPTSRVVPSDDDEATAGA